MRKSFLGMAIVALILSLVAVYQGGFLLMWQGLAQGWGMLVGIILLLMVAFLVAGLISVLVPEDLISKWLGSEAGWKGPILGALAGALVPGGPFFFYPLLATLLTSGAQAGTLISFVAAKTTWSLSRLPLEIALVGLELTGIRLIVTFSFPILLGIIINSCFPALTPALREDAEKLKMAAGKGDAND